MLTDLEIIKHLKDKERVLVAQLEKVRIALSAFSGDSIGGKVVGSVEVPTSNIDDYDQNFSLDQKVIYSLRKIGMGYIDDIVNCLVISGDKTDRDRLFKSLTGAASKLLGREILIADKRGKKYRYQLNGATEKERAEILPLNN